MSEIVNEIMERMVPDLQDLEANSIFSHEEIASIIRKRRNMEYAISSHSRRVEDYVLAIEYEINLETLRKMRKRRLGLSKPLICDYSIQKRILYTFERMVKKYPGKLDVWLRFVEYCETTGNTSRLSGLYPRILQLHPREEAIWVKAANWEMSIGNVTNARTFLQRAIRINKHSILLWKEYFRFELAYINLIEERRRVLGLSSLREQLSVVPDDTKLQESIERELNQEDDVSDPTIVPSDKELLEQSESDGMPSKTREVDALIQNQSDEAQIQFLKGGIPKVVYKNAMKECEDPHLALTFLEISYELNNSFVEKFILDDVLEHYGNESTLWRQLLSYPVARVSRYINSNDEDVVKKHRADIEEATAVCSGLAQIAFTRLSAVEGLARDRVYAEIIGGLTNCYKVLRVVDENCTLAGDIEKYIAACKDNNLMTPLVVKEIIVYHAIRGEIEMCVRLIKENDSLWFVSISFFDYCLSILISTFMRSAEIIESVFDSQNSIECIIAMFKKGFEQFKHENKEELLKLHVRYLKFLISVDYNEDLIRKAFRIAFEVKPELNSSVYLLFLSWSNEKGIEKAREAIHFAFTNEVLIPLDEELLNECLDIEKRYMASLEESQGKEREEGIEHIEKIYDMFCKRFSQNIHIWIDYIVFERNYNRYTQVQRIYNRAIHQVNDLASFEEKYNLLQIKGHL